MNLYLYSKITFDLICTYITFCICHQYNKSYCFIVTFFEKREISYIQTKIWHDFVMVSMCIGSFKERCVNKLL